VAGTTRDKENTVWKVHLCAGNGEEGGEQWFQIQDLIVEETRKEMIFLGETTLQVSSTSYEFLPRLNSPIDMAATKVTDWAVCRFPCSAAVEAIFGSGKQACLNLICKASFLLFVGNGLANWRVGGGLVHSIGSITSLTVNICVQFDALCTDD